ncbi:MAG: membrane-fusion protein [Curvibacter sp. PD_MW3]|nr:MAG: membrane-fusion protein [Curvibacter sp. PD_MW3]
MDFPGEKLVMKLWETLAEKGIGSLLTPWQTVREGRARNEIRRQELLMLAQAERDAADLRAGRKTLRPDGTLALVGPPPESSNRSDQRVEPVFDLPHAANAAARVVAANNVRSEINASKAVVFAEEQLAVDPQEPAPRQVDEDWLFAWRENAGKVSNEDLQRLWGSVLAGEVKSPGKYSIRTLDFLKALSKDEAELISNLARYVITARIFRSQNAYLESKGLNFNLLLKMQELGVISGVEAVGLTTAFKTNAEGKFLRVFVSHDKALVVEHEDPARSLEMEVYLLTEVGKQVLGLGSFEPDLDYLKLIGSEIASKGFQVQLADWENISETHGRYFNSQPVQSVQPPAEA